MLLCFNTSYAQDSKEIKHKNKKKIKKIRYHKHSPQLVRLTSYYGGFL